jgi:DNA-binding MarR family transcriptional regulator
MAGQHDAQVARADLVDLLTRARRALVRDLGAVLEEEGFTVDQWRVLRALAAQERTMGDLAAAVEIPHPTLTRVVDALADSALLYRSQSEQDRRRVVVGVSALGHTRLSRLEALATAHEQALASRVGAENIAHLTDLLRTLP